MEERQEGPKINAFFFSSATVHQYWETFPEVNANSVEGKAPLSPFLPLTTHWSSFKAILFLNTLLLYKGKCHILQNTDPTPGKGDKGQQENLACLVSCKKSQGSLGIELLVLLLDLTNASFRRAVMQSLGRLVCKPFSGFFRSSTQAPSVCSGC